MIVKLQLLIILLLFSVASQAAVFTVTNNADAGAGSLRDAITRANGNGTATPDRIEFSILTPDKRITLLSELPFLTSNIVIDGSTQPGATLHASTDAKILIQPINYPTVKRGFVIADAENVEIYGMAIVRFIPVDPINDFARFGDGIFMRNVQNIVIGAVGKGNLISACYYGIRLEPLAEQDRDPAPAIRGNNIYIHSNRLGPNPFGGFGPGVGAISGNFNSITLLGCSNVEVGRAATGFLNVFESIRGLTIQSATTAGQTSNIFVGGNRMRAVGSFNAAVNLLPKYGIIASTTSYANTGYTALQVFQNDIDSITFPIGVEGFKNQLRIVRNRFSINSGAGTGARPVTIAACDSVMLGGSLTDANYIFGNQTAPGITTLSSRIVTISRNFINCSNPGIVPGGSLVPIPAITGMDSLSTTQFSGTSCAGCKVEFFKNTSCPNLLYNGENFDSVVVCDAAGKFTYNGNFDCRTTMTATNPNGATSRFYAPYNFIIDTSGPITIKPATCGRNGSVSGIKFFKDVQWSWYDADGNAISSDSTLQAPAGTYFVKAKLKGPGCELQTRSFTIPGYNPVIDSSNMLVVQPSTCKPNGGSITGLTLFNANAADYRIEWRNQSGTLVGNQLNLAGVPAGSYTLTVTLRIDATCFITVGPKTLTITTGPAFNLSAAQVVQAGCGGFGSITGVQVANASTNPVFIWVNEANQISGTAIDLTGIGPGKYRLKYKDDSGCDTIFSPQYTISDSGRIVMNVGGLVIKPSNCTGNTGSFTGIIVTGADSVYWINTTTNDTASRNLDATNLAPGIYNLLVKNRFGCSQQAGPYQITSPGFMPIGVQTADKKNADCRGGNGYIRITQFTTAATGYQFAWFNTSNVQVAGSQQLNNITSGVYRLQATDANGCKQFIYTDSILQTGIPKMVLLKTAPDTCNAGKGRVTALTITSAAPLRFEWMNSSGALADTSFLLRNVPAGVYSLSAIDTSGCRLDSAGIVIGNVTVLLTKPVYQHIVTIRGADTVLRVQNAASGTYILYDAARNEISRNNTGRFYFTNITQNFSGFVLLQNGDCTAPETAVKIDVVDSSYIKMPNAFSPNGDGIHDEFKVNYTGLMFLKEFLIFDRFGKLVYTSINIDKGWNGTQNGRPVPAGVYYWMLRATDAFGKAVRERGSVLVVR